MRSNESLLPIRPADLDAYNQQADTALAAVKWTPKLEKGKTASSSEYSVGTQAAVTAEVSLLKIARALSANGPLLSEDTNHALHTVRQGLRIGAFLSKNYVKTSGLEDLMVVNNRNQLTEIQKTEMREKTATASAITVFGAAYYIAWEIGAYKADKVAGVKMDFGGIPELSLDVPVKAVNCMLFYYAAYLERSGVVKSELDFLKMTLLYFSAIVDEIRMRADSLKHTEFFTRSGYKLTDSEFAVMGFEAELGGVRTSVDFKRVDINTIVGNRDAKSAAFRLAQRLVCYDPEVKRNPFADIGGVSMVRMGFGEPGTGKSLQIAATATLLADYCEMLEMPFLFWPLPDTVVSTFQGGSAERVAAWFAPLRDPTRIIYAPIDDAENNLEERTRQGVSSGVREVIGVFLRNTEGATAINHGNAAIEVFTNLQEQIDKAVLSRIGARFYIGGAKTWQDFLDQDYLWWRKVQEIQPGFVDLKDPRDYKYMEAQKLLVSLSQMYDKVTEPADPIIQGIYHDTLKVQQPDEHKFFAVFFERLKARFPFFTSRDVRNIQSAVNERTMDFDLPPEWFENPERFFRKPYDVKRTMIADLTRQNMKGLTFGDIRLQETFRYCDGMVKIVEAGRRRAIEQRADQIRIEEEARLLVYGDRK